MPELKRQSRNSKVRVDCIMRFTATCSGFDTKLIVMYYLTIFIVKSVVSQWLRLNCCSLKEK